MVSDNTVTVEKNGQKVSFVRPLRCKDCDEEGGFSFYFNIGNGLGLKAIYSYFKDCGVEVWKPIHDFSCLSSPENLIKSELWTIAETEFNLLKKAQHLPYVPRAYGMIPVPIKDFTHIEYGEDGEEKIQKKQVWLPGIVMQHISGEPIYNAIQDKEEREVFGDYILKVAKKDGLILTDHKMFNILVEPNIFGKSWGARKWWIIDFTPDFVTVIKRRK